MTHRARYFPYLSTAIMLGRPRLSPMSCASPARVRSFPYAPDHATYINYAARAAKGEIGDPLLIAENPATYAPRLGDWCAIGRGPARDLSFADLPTRYIFPAHCGIVTFIGPNHADIIGGNVWMDAVVLEHLHTDARGRLVNNQENWFVILRVLYSED